MITDVMPESLDPELGWAFHFPMMQLPAFPSRASWLHSVYPRAIATTSSRGNPLNIEDDEKEMPLKLQILNQLVLNL